MISTTPMGGVILTNTRRQVPMPDRSRTIKAIEPMGTDPAPMGTTSTMTTDAAIQIGGARPGDTATDLATTLTPTIGFGVQLGAKGRATYPRRSRASWSAASTTRAAIFRRRCAISSKASWAARSGCNWRCRCESPAVAKCTACDDLGCVCENHPDYPWDGPRACGCGGAGAPCPACNIPADGDAPRMPDGFRLEVDRAGSRVRGTAWSATRASQALG